MIQKIINGRKPILMRIHNQLPNSNVFLVYSITASNRVLVTLFRDSLYKKFAQSGDQLSLSNIRK